MRDFEGCLWLEFWCVRGVIGMMCYVWVGFCSDWWLCLVVLFWYL